MIVESSISDIGCTQVGIDILVELLVLVNNLDAMLVLSLCWLLANRREMTIHVEAIGTVIGIIYKFMEQKEELPSPRP